MKLLKHQCAESNLVCTKCSKPVCRNCMKVAPSGVTCETCIPKTWKQKRTIVPTALPSIMRMQAASVMLSLMFAKILSMITPCIG